MEDLEVTTEDIPGWVVASDGKITAALDLTLTDELKAEGIARELVNRIQNIRKSRDFNLTDKIEVHLQNHQIIQPAIAHYLDYITKETLTAVFKVADNLQGEEIIQLDDEVQLGISVKVSN